MNRALPNDEIVTLAFVNMTSSKISLHQLGTLFLIYFTFIWIAPSIRISLFGSAASTNLLDSLVTLAPDIFLLTFLGIVFFRFRNDARSWEWSTLTFFDKSLIFFWASNLLLGFILAMSPKLSLLGFRITYLSMTLYAAGRLLATEKKSSGRIMNGILYLTTFFSIVGILIYFVFPDLSSSIANASGYQEGRYFIARMTSILWTPVLFGTITMIALSYTAYRILFQKWNLGYVFFLLLWFCLFMTVSRGPIIAFIISFFTLTILSRNWKQAGILSVIIIVVAFLVSIVAVGDLQMLKWMFSSTGETLALDEELTRVDRWSETWKDFYERPYGYGLGKAGAVAYRYLIHSDIPSAPYSTDGWLLKIACETGIYGVASYLLLCVVFFANAIKKLRKNTGGLLPLALALFLATNAQALISNVYDFFPYIGVYWLVLGLSEEEKERSSLIQ